MPAFSSSHPVPKFQQSISFLPKETLCRLVTLENISNWFPFYCDWLILSTRVIRIGWLIIGLVLKLICDTGTEADPSNPWARALPDLRHALDPYRQVLDNDWWVPRFAPACPVTPDSLLPFSVPGVSSLPASPWLSRLSPHSPARVWNYPGAHYPPQELALPSDAPPIAAASLPFWPWWHKLRDWWCLNYPPHNQCPPKIMRPGMKKWTL